MPVGQGQLSPWNSPTAVNPVNEALKSAVSMYYAPQEKSAAINLAKAQAFNQQFAPLATIATSPVATAMLPDQQAQMAQVISRLLQQNSAGGTGGAPNYFSSLLNGLNRNNSGNANPSSGSGAVMGNPPSPGASADAGGATGADVASQQNQQQIADYGNNTNPNAPSSDQRTAIKQHVLAPYGQQLHPAGTQYTTPNGDMSAPTGGQVNQAQTTMTAYQNLKDLIPKLLKDSKQFENKSFDIQRAKVAQEIKSYHGGAIANLVSQEPELAGNWNNFKQSVNRAGVVLKGLYPSSGSQEAYNQHMAMLDFDPSADTIKTYGDRLKQVLNDGSIAYKNAQNQAGNKGGYNLNKEPVVPKLSYSKDQNDYDRGQASGPNLIWMKDKSGAVHRVHVANIKDATAAGLVRAT